MKTRLLRRLRRKFSKYYTLECVGGELGKYELVHSVHCGRTLFKTIDEAEEYKRKFVRADIIAWCEKQRCVAEANKFNKKYLW